ncbi:ABC transporter ATP-binding protein [Neofamilia massiliensis]|uniref:ABC transporter ATP-binding protein n=1 Tax=Neofamilia massiliensis TaxID=1673724 RepID=UPI0006BB5EDD|nr:ABC transporter ATP-binding protein [Neofamilia massiliensis]
MTKNKKSKEVYSRLFAYGKRVKKELTIAFIILFILTGLQIIMPMLIGNIIDDKLGQDHLIELRSIGFLLVGYLVVGLIQAVIRYLSSMSFMKTANLVAIEIRRDLFDHIQRLPQKYFDNISAGKVVSRITNDTNALKSLFQTLLGQMVTSAVYIIAIFFVLLFKGSWAVLFVLVPMPIMYFLIKFYNKYSSQYNHDFRRSLSQINSDINENIKGMEVIKTTNTEDGVYQAFEKVSEENFQTGLKIEWLDSFVSFNATQTLSNINVLVVLLVFGLMNLKGNPNFSVGLMYILLDYTQRIYSALQQVLNRLREIQRSLAAADHIFEIFSMEAEEEKEVKGLKLEGNVSFKDVSFYYKDEDYVLKNISFEVPAGKTLALVGQTGSGKSSIINLLFRFYREQKGQVLFDGVDANAYSLSDLRSNMAIVLQEPFIYQGTLRENITLGRDYADEDVIAALEAVGGKNLFDNLGRNLDTVFSEAGSGLSQGEKQIITFARAIIRDPKILVLDEATSSIDSETESFIQVGLEKLKEGRTTFVIAHRLSTIKDADEILVLSYGNIVERGSHQDLVDLGGLYYDMLMKESK